MKGKLFSFIVILLLFLIIKPTETNTYRYLENNVENYLLPKPDRIKKGDKIIEINSNEIEIKFSQKEYFSDDHKKNEVDLLREIKTLYLKIFKGEYKSKFNKFYNDSTKNNKEDDLTKINLPSKAFNKSFSKNVDNVKKYSIIIDLDVKFVSIKKFSDEYAEKFQDIEYYELRLIESEKDFNVLNVSIQTKYLNGLLRALETLSQILIFDPWKKSYKIFNLPLEIYDKPSFAYRGVMIDSSRHFLDKEKIKEILDGMLFSKLNVFHWHLTDDEYFSINFSTENMKLIRNTRFAYTREDIKEIINYAFVRGITIIPEIDSPAHTRSWKDMNFTNFTNDIVISKAEVGILNPSLNKTYDLIIEIISKTADYFEIFNNNQSGYIHLGGDEIESKMWDREDIIEYMKKKNIQNISDLENYFFNNINSELNHKYNSKKNYEAKFIYWVDDNLKRYYDVYYRDNSILMYWGKNSNIKKFLDNFNKNLVSKSDNKTPKNLKNIIISSGDFLYMDCGLGNKYGDGTWCGDFKTWKNIYSIPLLKNYENFNILGAQITLFGELTDNFNIVAKIFPRALSLSEKLWNFEYNDQFDSYKNKELFVKINNHNKRLNSRGVESSSITSQLCENHPEICIDEIK